MAYEPTKTPMLGEKLWLSNGTEMASFLDSWCSNCARDRAMREGADLDECDDDEVCEIIAAAFRGQAVEWREMPDGETLCVAFVPAGDALPPARCTQTRDLFEQEAAE